MQPNTLLITTLQNILIYCRDIHQLLKNDIDFFKNDQFNLIEQSNSKKIELTEKINQLIKQLSQSDKKYITEKIKQSSIKYEKTDEVGKIVIELNEEMMRCYQYIVTNSHIVFSNLQMLKEIFDKLIELKSDKQLVYNESGSIDKW